VSVGAGLLAWDRSDTCAADEPQLIEILQVMTPAHCNFL
jgi:hypothetical protein